MRSCADRSGSNPLLPVVASALAAGLAGGPLVTACAEEDEFIGEATGAAAREARTREDGPRLPIYLDRTYSAEERAADRVSSMSLEEKASQLISSQSPAIARLGVREYGWWNEAAHGAAREGTRANANPPILINTTSYPVDLSL